jgi:hypothetical protein
MADTPGGATAQTAVSVKRCAVIVRRNAIGRAKNQSAPISFIFRSTLSLGWPVSGRR